MNHFAYRQGRLWCEDADIARIAETVGTPFYCYSSATIRRHYGVFAEAFADVDALICYAVKANANLAVLATLAREGAGADVVSEGELRRALRAGIAPGRIVFSGVGKTEAEIAFALEAGIHQFNVESEPELETIGALAHARGKRAPVAIRVNPHIDARSHDKISTGRAGDKFGIDWSRARAVFAHAARLDGIEVVGIDVHIGSQLTDLAPFAGAYSRIAALVGELRADGHAIRRLDLGGGLGIPYDQEEPPDPVEYAGMTKQIVRHLGCSLVLEPGRMIVGNAGMLVSRVLYVKETEAARFVIVDAAMNDLMRPALYDAFHAVMPLVEPAAGTVRTPVDIVGPVCESSDAFARRRLMPPLVAGDLVALCSAGAYGASMASGYNSRLLVPEVLVAGADHAIVRARPTYEDVMAMDRIPAWLAPARTAGAPKRGRGAA